MHTGKGWFWGEYRHKDGTKISPTEKKVFSRLADRDCSSSGSWLECAKKVASANGLTLQRKVKKVTKSKTRATKKKKTTRRKKRKG